jgi:hypothetical protein
VDRHTHPCQDVLAGTGSILARPRAAIKTVKVEAVYLMDYETFAMSLRIFLAALKTSTTLGGSTPGSAT